MSERRAFEKDGIIYSDNERDPDAVARTLALLQRIAALVEEITDPVTR